MAIDPAIATIIDSVNTTLNAFIAFLPKLLIFLVFIIFGYIVSKISSFVVSNIAKRFVERFQTSADTPDAIEEIYSSTPNVLGKFVFWFLLLFFLVAGIEALGFTTLTKIAGWITFYLPQLLAGLLILFLGIWAGNLIASFIERKGRSWDIEHPEYIAAALRWFVILVSSSIALSQTGIRSELIIVIFGIVLFCSIGAIALSFALSVQETLKRYIQVQTLRQEFEIGDIIDVLGERSEIIDFAHTAIILKTTEGKTRLPIDLLQSQPYKVIYKSKP